MEKIKRIFICLICLVLIFGFVGCDFNGDDDEDNSATDFYPRDDTYKREVIFTEADVTTLEDIKNETLPEMISRVKSGTVAIEVSAGEFSKKFGTGLVISNPFYTNDEGQTTETLGDNNRVYIVTSYKLIENANNKNISIIDLNDDKHYSVASIEGVDPQTDICVLTIKEKPASLRPILFMKSSDEDEGPGEIVAGKKIFTLCNMYGGGQGLQASSGIIGGCDFEFDLIGERKKSTFFSTDTAFSSGCQGGGVFTENGILIGMICNVGNDKNPFAIPYEELKNVCRELIEKGYVEGRYKIGVKFIGIDDAWGQTIYVKVDSVSMDGSLYANGKGLQSGDIIRSLTIDDTKFDTITDINVLYNNLYEHYFDIGDEITFNIERNGIETSVTVKILQFGKKE